MSIGLMFAGQGAQQVGMGRSLVENSSRARELYRRASEALGWDLQSISFSGPETTLLETGICQPALYVHGYALYAALEEQGRLPNLGAVLGLSLGELTACAVAGVFDFETGLRVVAERGRLMQMACEATQGTMASLIGGSPEDVAALAAEHDVDIANLNSPGQIVLAGETAKIEAAVAAAKASGKFKMVVPLKVAGAYHSRLMEPARVAFAEYLQDVAFQTPRLPIIQNATAEATRDPEVLRENLVRQVTASVRWYECLRTAWGLGLEGFYELGPGGILANLAKRTDRSWPVKSFSEWAEVAA